MGKINDLTSTIKECLTELEKKQIGRAVILAQNFEGKRAGGWVNNEEKAYYHPNTLPELEIQAKNYGENYQTIALVNGHEPRVLKQSPVSHVFQEKDKKECGIEIITRNPTYTMGIDDFENNKYVNEWQFAEFENESAIEEVATYLVDLGINSKEFKKIFDRGVKEYNDVTVRLMEESGAIEAREKLEDQPIGADKYLQSARVKIAKQDILKKINKKVEEYKKLI
ncbi:hypothetical protein JXA48_04125 [Candidatus Woesearchaeota archaeon]|nr:hypothetical protein [Candidatus Woesearchaeota archaeon]